MYAPTSTFQRTRPRGGSAQTHLKRNQHSHVVVDERCSSHEMIASRGGDRGRFCSPRQLRTILATAVVTIVVARSLSLISIGIGLGQTQLSSKHHDRTVIQYDLGRKGGLEREELGRATWGFLHTMASNLDDETLKNDTMRQRKLADFLYLLSEFFPCSECAGHFQKLLRAFPPDPHVTSREEFSQYLCNAHNIVNRRLGHPEFDCKKNDDLWQWPSS